MPKKYWLAKSRTILTFAAKLPLPNDGKITAYVEQLSGDVSVCYMWNAGCRYNNATPLSIEINLHGGVICCDRRTVAQ